MVRLFTQLPPLHVEPVPLWRRKTPSPKWAELWWSFQCWCFSTFLYRASAFSAAGTCRPGLAFMCCAESSALNIESIWYKMEDVNGIYPKGRWPGHRPFPVRDLKAIGQICHIASWEWPYSLHFWVKDWQFSCWFCELNLNPVFLSLCYTYTKNIPR